MAEKSQHIRSCQVLTNPNLSGCLWFGGYCLLQFHLAPDWLQNKHSRNFLWCLWFYGKHCSERIWIIWQMLKLKLAINTFRSLWKNMFSSSKYVKFPSHQHPKRFLWKFSGVSFKLNYCRMHPLELFKNRCYFQC